MAVGEQCASMLYKEETAVSLTVSQQHRLQTSRDPAQDNPSPSKLRDRLCTKNHDVIADQNL